jgi:hypothetical protein
VKYIDEGGVSCPEIGGSNIYVRVMKNIIMQEGLQTRE